MTTHSKNEFPLTDRERRAVRNIENAVLLYLIGCGAAALTGAFTVLNTWSYGWWAAVPLALIVVAVSVFRIANRDNEAITILPFKGMALSVLFGMLIGAGGVAFKFIW